MSKAVLWVDVSSSVSEALRVFTGYPVHHLPVVRERTLVGMLSSADIMKLDGFLPNNVASIGGYLDQKFTIEELMSRPAISIGSQRPVEDAARLMVVHAIHSLPVVSDQDHLLGIITTTDMMQALLFGPPHAEDHSDSLATTRASEASLSAEALESSVEAARKAVFAENDPNGIARTLLYFYERTAVLEELREVAHRYAIERRDDIQILLEVLEREEDLGVSEHPALAVEESDAQPETRTNVRAS
ncbi:MAG: CBS domain-containing protein [Gammaproteobacteria bacterium]